MKSGSLSKHTHSALVFLALSDLIYDRLPKEYVIKGWLLHPLALSLLSLTFKADTATNSLQFPIKHQTLIFI